MRFDNYLAIAVGDIAVSQNSARIDASYLVAGSVAVNVSSGSSPVGAVKIQASNDSPNVLDANMHWVDVTGLTVAVTATGTVLIPKFDICYQWIRVVYTTTSGTGAFTARFKGIGF